MIKKVLILSIAAFIVIILLSITAVPVLAFDARGGTDVTVASGQVIDGDLYIGATNITIDGTVNGDVFAAGQTILINGTINGGISLAGQTVTVNGKVSTGARIAGQTVSVGGNIGRDLVVAASEVTINSSAVIGRDLNAYASTAIIKGSIMGNVTGSINDLTISSGIGGNVKVTVTSLLITSSAKIQGNLNYTSNNIANVQSGATIGGTTSRTVPSNVPTNWLVAGIIGSLFFRIFAFLSIFIIGLVLLFVARRYITSLAIAINDHPASSLGWGALILFITPIAAFIVMFTIIGIPLGLLSLVIWGILLYLSQIPVALLIGWLILSRRRDTYSYGILTGCLALGLVILYVISLIPIFGWLMWLFVLMFGLGSLISVFRTRRNVNEPTPVP